MEELLLPCAALQRMLQGRASLALVLQGCAGPAEFAPYAAGPCTACIGCCSAMHDLQAVLCKVCTPCCWDMQGLQPVLQGYALLCTWCCRTTHHQQTALQHHAKFALHAARLCQVCIWCCRAAQDLQSALQNWHPMLQGHAQLASGAAVRCGMDKQCLQGHARFAPCDAGPCRVCIWCFRICTHHCRTVQDLHPELQDLQLALQGHEGFAAMLQHAPCRPCTQHHSGPTALPQPHGSAPS